MRRICLIAVLTLIATAACSPGERPVVQRAAGTVLMASAREPDAYMMAIVGGTLTRNKRGCVALSDPSGGVAVLLLPYRTKLAQDGQSIDLPRVGVVRFGDQVEYGGGHGTLDGLAGVPSECAGGTELVAFN